MLQKPSLLTRLYSKVQPVRILSTKGSLGSHLELYFYKGGWQLATGDVLYSDGKAYKPLQAAFSKIKHELSSVTSVLFLGSGIASGVQILDEMGFYPAITLVEIDSIILDLAIQILPDHLLQNVKVVCTDAQFFFKETSDKQYDLVVVDIFVGRNIPAFATSEDYLLQCKQAMGLNGILVLNFIPNNAIATVDMQNVLARCFGVVSPITLGINTVFICRK